MGAQGAVGPTGAQGPIGPQGPAGPINVTIRTATLLVPTSGTHSLTASCNAGETVIGGGWDVPAVYVYASRPDGATGWYAQVRGANGLTLTVYAMCTS